MRTRPIIRGFAGAAIFCFAMQFTHVWTSPLAAQDVPALPTQPEKPQVTSRIPHFGINYVYHGVDQYIKRHGGTPDEYVKHQNDKLADLGGVWLRSAGPGDWTSLSWPLVEPDDGKFDFAAFDSRMKDLQARNISILGDVDFSDVPSYAQSPGTYFSDEKYLVYLDRIVERYDGDGKDDMPGLTKPVTYWEIGNEPGAASGPWFGRHPEDFAHVLEISWKSIKANCPDCVVIIGGLAVGQLREEDKWQKTLRMFDAMLSADAGKWFDIMNYHEYTDDCDFLTYYHVKGFKELLSKHGLTKPFWITEANTKLQKEGKGKYEGLEVKHSVERQAQDIVKRAVVAFDAGVEVFFWHRIDDIKKEAFGVGLYDEDDKPKPVCLGLKLMIGKIGEFETVERIDLKDDNLYFYKFKVKDGFVHVLWTEGKDGTLDLASSFDSKELELTAAVTDSAKPAPEVKKVASSSVPVTMTPLFISVVKK